MDWRERKSFIYEVLKIILAIAKADDKIKALEEQVKEYAPKHSDWTGPL
jgi:hypothetical protein